MNEQEIKQKVELINNEAHQQQKIVETQAETDNWLKLEYESQMDSSYDGERLEALKLEENKLVEFTVDLETPFEKYVQRNEDGKEVIKKIIKVHHKGALKNLWLNVRNPLYGQIVKHCYEFGNNTFKVMTTGTQDKTRYTLVEDDTN